MIYEDYLKHYQRQAVQKGLRKFKGRVLFALEMGLGKSIIALSCLQEVGGVSLICAPASLKFNWKCEIEKFWPECNVYICAGRKPPKDNLTKVQVFLINYEILQFWRPYFLKLGFQNFVADESHFLKEKSAKRTKAAMQLAAIAKNSFILTGTPIENKPIELWSQLALINEKMFPSWLLFAKRYNGAVRDSYGWRMTRATRTKELHQFLINRCMIRMKKEDVLKELPPNIHQIINLEINNRSDYQKASDDIIEWLRKNNNSNLNLEKTKKAQAVVRLDKLKNLAAKGKMDQMVEWINSTAENKKLVVFCYHVDILQELHKRLIKHVFVPSDIRGAERQECVKQFQEKENIRIFLTTIKIGGTGLTLTASDTTVFCQLSWTASSIDQACSRVNRIGQTSSRTDSIFFIAQNTVEEQIMNLIDVKLKDATAVIDGGEVEEQNLLSELMRNMLKTK